MSPGVRKYVFLLNTNALLSHIRLAPRPCEKRVIFVLLVDFQTGLNLEKSCGSGSLFARGALSSNLPVHFNISQDMAEEPTVVAVAEDAAPVVAEEGDKKKRAPFKRDETPVEELFDLTKPIPRVSHEPSNWFSY
jgi:hypothetical protein